MPGEQNFLNSQPGYLFMALSSMKIGLRLELWVFFLGKSSSLNGDLNYRDIRILEYYLIQTDSSLAVFSVNMVEFYLSARFCFLEALLKMKLSALSVCASEKY